MTIFVFIVCFVASTIGGVCGVGGGVVIKPLLDAIGIMTVSTLSFLSGLTVLAMSIVNVSKNRNSRDIDAKRSVPLGIGAALGGITGKQIFHGIKDVVNSERLVGLVQSVVLGLLLLGTLIYVYNKNHVYTREFKNPIFCMIIGILLGILSSFLGIGGGPMNLIVLYYFFSMNTMQGAINSIIIILLSQFASFCVTLISNAMPVFDWGVLIAMVSGGIIGGLISAKLRKKLSPQKVDRLFILLIIVILLICIYNISALL